MPQLGHFSTKSRMVASPLKQNNSTVVIHNPFWENLGPNGLVSKKIVWLWVPSGQSVEVWDRLFARCTRRKNWSQLARHLYSHGTRRRLLSEISGDKISRAAAPSATAAHQPTSTRTCKRNQDCKRFVTPRFERD